MGACNTHAVNLAKIDIRVPVPESFRIQLFDITHGDPTLNTQAWIGIALLAVLTALAVKNEVAAGETAAVAPEVNTAEFSVTPIAEGHYVMRANNKIFYCVSNKCTGIQLINAQQAAAAGAKIQQPEAQTE